MIPKYIVFNTNMPDKNGNALPVGQGDNLDEIDEYYFEDKKVKALYAVVNMKNTDRYGLPTFVKFGYDLQQLLTTYHGESYKIFNMGEI